jgi:CRP-like cAMP-binding protein
MTTALELLAEHPFFTGLPPDSVGRLAATARRVGYPTGHRIFHEGASAQHFWLIHTGRVALDLHVPGRGDVLIETLLPGAVLGWSWLFPPNRWHLGAAAAEPTHTVEFDAAAVMRLCEADPRFGVVADRLQATRVRLLDLYGYPEVAR